MLQNVVNRSSRSDPVIAGYGRAIDERGQGHVDCKTVRRDRSQMLLQDLEVSRFQLQSITAQ